MNITRAQAQGLRDYQEDRFVVSRTRDGLLIGVFDGHGGASVSSKAAKILPSTWKRRMEFPPSIETSVCLTCKDINEQTMGMEDGSTMSLVFIPKAQDFAYVAILGDSPVVIQDADGKINISPQHNARSNAEELKQAKNRGAFFDGNYIYAHYNGHGIQMTRVLGDRDLGRIVFREPEIYKVAINTESFVLAATDGLFDPSNINTNAAAGAIAQYIREGATASDLVNRAVATPTGDNVTAILVRVGNKKARKKAKKK